MDDHEEDRNDQGLVLSLSLNCCPEIDQNHGYSRPCPTAPPPEKSLEIDAFFHGSGIDRRKADQQSMSLFCGVGANGGLAAAVECDEDQSEEMEGTSPDSMISSVSGKRTAEREEDGGERGFLGSVEMEEDGTGDAATRKKLRLTKEQAAVMEETFEEHNTLNPRQKMGLAKQLNLRPRQVEVWFQNRRARTKLKKREVDHEYLRQCCEDLSEENRRLQKEIKDLRALKLSPSSSQPSPTTLTRCARCQCVAASSATSSTSSSITAIDAATMASQAVIVPPQPL